MINTLFLAQLSTTRRNCSLHPRYPSIKSSLTNKSRIQLEAYLIICAALWMILWASRLLLSAKLDLTSPFLSGS